MSTHQGATQPSGKEEIARAIVEDSGHTFHSKVVQELRRLEWNVLVSPYYSDNFTEKPREIDIIAEKRINISPRFKNSPFPHDLLVRLLVECKNIKDDYVFFFDKLDTKKAQQRVEEDFCMAGMPLDSRLTRIHHYLKNPSVAKLNSSKKGRPEAEQIDKAINQVLNSLVYYRGHGALVSQFPPESILRCRVNYPVVVCDSFSRFSQTEISDQSVIKEIMEPFCMEMNYAYIDRSTGPESEYFLVDFLQFDNLETFLGEIEKSEIGYLIPHLGMQIESERRSSRGENKINPV